MIRSMTGFGAAHYSAEGWTVSAECRSVNQKALEVKVYLPRQVSAFEPVVTEKVKEVVRRGRVDIRFDLQRDESNGSWVDPEKFAAIAQQLRMLATSNGLGSPTVGDVLSFREIQSSTDSFEPVAQSILDAVATEALDQLVAARTEEGEKLAATLRGLVEIIRTTVDRVESEVPRVVEDYAQRLQARVKDAVARFDAGDLDEQRLVQEVLIYADRSDIAEEIQRTRSHLSKLSDLLNTPPEEPCGKRIDFYLQELFREANTMGSKSSAAELTDAVVIIKSAIEQMREQAANIE